MLGDRSMKFLFPEGKKKALTFSYDDGRSSDAQLIGLFNRYGLHGTFHLNSGMLDCACGEIVFVKSEEIQKLYSGHEIACHGVLHKNLGMLSEQQVLSEIWNDRKNLESISGQLVQGMSYAFGFYNDRIKQIACSAGIVYSRTVMDTCDFYPPVDFLEWHPTCHHENHLIENGERFLRLPDFYELPVMDVWGHSFELAQNGWETMEAFAEKMAGREEIWYATNLQICRYIQAVKSLVFSADEKVIYNPTATEIWFSREGRLDTIKGGATL